MLNNKNYILKMCVNILYKIKKGIAFFTRGCNGILLFFKGIFKFNVKKAKSEEIYERKNQVVNSHDSKIDKKVAEMLDEFCRIRYSAKIPPEYTLQTAMDRSLPSVDEFVDDFVDKINKKRILDSPQHESPQREIIKRSKIEIQETIKNDGQTTVENDGQTTNETMVEIEEPIPKLEGEAEEVLSKSESLETVSLKDSQDFRKIKESLNKELLDRFCDHEFEIIKTEEQQEYF